MKLFWGIVILVVASFFVVMILSTDSEENSHREIDAQASSDKDSDEEVSSPMLNSFEEDFDFCVSGSNLFIDKHTYSDGIIREFDEKSSEVGMGHLVFWEQLEAGLNNYLEINPTDAERLVLLDKVVKAKDIFYEFYKLREGEKYELARMTTNFLTTHYSEEAEDYEEVLGTNLNGAMYIEDVSDSILLALDLGEYSEEVKKHYKEQYTRIHKIYRVIYANLISNEFKNQIYNEGRPLRESGEFESLVFMEFTLKYLELQTQVVHLIAEERSLDFKPFNKLFKKTIKTNNLDRNLVMDNL
ncbi:hypothetical protein [Streptococcus sp. NLN76]|uniref:hypothetical protein n=1 Tax=Streptococcus sp. NLN76 TaxID=2822800 RepID=UPI0018AB956C|nr:hypothetical protein [Streptococcus sp. NLN76]MBF8970641.1 hypothetical protein [Streptococcus sp. NLN76]